MKHIESRPSWNELFMKHAILTAKRSVCLRRQTGAVIVKNNRIISTGYNGSPPGTKHCYELGGCVREMKNINSGGDHNQCRAIHGEINAILNAPTSTNGCVMYSVYSPCSVCMRIIIGARIREIFFIKKYVDKIAFKLAKESGIRLLEFSYPNLLDLVSRELHPIQGKK